LKKQFYNMANSKIDNQMERMRFLMEYKTTPKVDTKAGIEYTINTADGKTYGIIRENSMYYIKTTTPDKAAIKESYEYLNGYNYRKENGYKSFNEASKHLELMIMGINESCGKHEDVSILLNPNKGKEDMRSLTESARTELDRMHQIFENSGNIGHYKNPFSDKESKGTASAENTEKNNAPFEKKTEATLDKDPKFNGTVDGATPDNKEVAEGTVDSDLQSDKMKSTNSGSEKDFKDTHDDLEGEGVADKKPSGAKAVKMNEGIMEQPIDEPIDEPTFTPDDFNTEPGLEGGVAPEEGGEEGLAGFDDERDIELSDFDFEEDNGLDELLREFLDSTPDINIGSNNNVSDNTVDASVPAPLEEEESVKNGGEAILKGEGEGEKGGNSVHGEETMDKIDENAENTEPEGAGEKESKIVGPEETFDGPHGSLDVQTWDKLQESIDRITDNIYNRLCENKAAVKKPKTQEELLKESIDRIVAEEVHKLDAWGKHPRYQKPAFETPDNKEVSVNGSEDWNDDSTKGSEAYGKKVGSSAPFDKAVDMLTDAVVNAIKESYVKKK
jgi:hypothetical protein